MRGGNQEHGQCSAGQAWVRGMPGGGLRSLHAARNNTAGASVLLQDIEVPAYFQMQLEASVRPRPCLAVLAARVALTPSGAQRFSHSMLITMLASCCATALQARNKQYNALSNKILQKEREMQQAEGQLKVGGAPLALCVVRSRIASNCPLTAGCKSSLAPAPLARCSTRSTACSSK